MVTEEAVKVVAEYWDTRIANAVASVFIGSLNNLNILITGDSGVGKTTYAYYGLKVVTLNTSLRIGASGTVAFIALRSWLSGC